MYLRRLIVQAGGEESNHWSGFLPKLYQIIASVADNNNIFRSRATQDKQRLHCDMTTRSSTPSEGEIIESDSEKATKSPQSVHGNTVDRQSRKCISVSRSPSPIRSPIRRKSHTRSRSRSPYREKRGAKRLREDDTYNHHDRNDPRRFKVHYEDHRRDDKVRNRGRYNDSDKARDSDPALRYDDRGLNGRVRDKRPRTQSRSPPRFRDKKSDRGNPGYGNEDHKMQSGRGRSGSEYRESKERLLKAQSVSDRGNDPVATVFTRQDAETRNLQTQQSSITKLNTNRAPDKYVSDQQFLSLADSATISASANGSAVGQDAQAPVETQPMDEATLIEERRKRREAIKAKYKGQETPLLVQALVISGNSTTMLSKTETVGANHQVKGHHPFHLCILRTKCHG